MPVIADVLKRSVFYLYANKEAALRGDSAGGSGFFVWAKTPNGRDCIYAVTNNHVVNRDGFKVMRLVDNQGGAVTLDMSNDKWEPHSTADIAIAAMSIDHGSHSYQGIPVSWIITPELLRRANVKLGSIDVGDEVYMVGRFSHHAGRVVNLPSARSGMISLLPDSNAKIPLKGCDDQEAFLIELRSYFGFSGSPVMWRNEVSEFNSCLKIVLKEVYGIEPIKTAPANDFPIALLGVDAGAFGNTGFAVVIPAWFILEVLNGDVFMTQRAKMDEGDAMAADTHSFPDDDAPITQAIFETALQEASRRISLPDQETKETSELHRGDDCI